MSARARSPVTAAAAERLVRGVLRAEAVRHAVISVTFVGRRRIRALNARHLGRDRDTDVIAFTLSGGPPRRRPGGQRREHASRRTGRSAGAGLPAVVGDVYVCVPVCAAQARRFGTTAAEEVRRLLVHGLLHVLGHDHPEAGGRTAAPMWRRQERLLRRLVPHR